VARMEVDRMSAGYLVEMLPGEVEERLKEGKDIAILPIYSLEQHGPHLLLGTDGYGAEGLAQELGRISGGAVLPPIPFCWEGCTNVFAGGIGVRESVFVRYLKSAVKGLWQSGFRRIVVINTHGGNFYAMRTFPHELLKEERVPVLTVYGLSDCREAHKLLREAGGEAAALTGALLLLGRKELVAKVQETNRKAVAEFGDGPKVELDPPAARESRKLGNVGHDYSHECFHVQPSSRLDPEKGAQAMRKVAEHIAALLDDYGVHVRRLVEEGKAEV
jgi:creatinine amidohydrolase/Fe(II)-dependent formamide hydrolase-like protein